MGRPERPLDASGGPIAEFAQELRALRHRAGNPSYRELARVALFAPSVLSSAAAGYRLPTLQVTLAFVAACGGESQAWERRWRGIAGSARIAADSREKRADEAGRPRPRASAPLARPAQLPLGPATFVARTQALARATQLIRQCQPARPPLTISGPIGVGKTAFALRLADDVSAEFGDGQLYADLSAGEPTSQAPGDVIAGFLRALDVPASHVPADLMQRVGLYRSLLAQRRLFVLLENARDERQVRPLLGRAPHSQIVITSRAQLLGLEEAHRIDLAAFARQESIALIGQLAGAERVQAEYEAADAIAGLCGDLPLAIAIIGRKIAARPEWSIAHLAALLADRGRLMDCLRIGDLSVRDRFAAAYRQLPAAERQALSYLVGLNAVGWTTAIGLAAGIGSTVDSADELLESLVHAGLLTRAGVAGRYHMSTVVTAFVTSLQADAARMAVQLAARRPQHVRL